MAMNGFRGSRDQRFARLVGGLLNQRGAGLTNLDQNDEAMSAAIRDFQQSKGLPQTGMADDRTLAKLREPIANIEATGTAMAAPPGQATFAPGQPLEMTDPNALLPAPVNDMPLPPAEKMPDPAQDTSDVDGGWTMQGNRAMTGPGGSPAPMYPPTPPMPTEQQSAAYWGGDISQPPPWAPPRQALPEISTGNSPLASGIKSYNPDQNGLAQAIMSRGAQQPNQAQKVAATAELIRQLQMRGQQGAGF